MNEYGGCLHFELLNGEYGGGYYDEYENKIDVDSGRSALQYIIQNYRYKRIWLPVYNCPLVAERIKTVSDIELCWYNINEDFSPQIKENEVGERDILLWVNYCGVMFQKTIEKVIRLKEKTGIEIIIDNIPAYFSKPRMEVLNIYSCRKFLGVPDGGHIIGNIIKKEQLPIYSTAENYLYLLKAVESGSNAAYVNYQESEARFTKAKIAYGMPCITSHILSKLDYSSILNRRKENFTCLSNLLAESNELLFDINSNTASVYPYLIKKGGLREKLLENNIYISRFWKHVITNEKANSFEKMLAEYLLPIPIDQRYSSNEMLELANKILELEN